MIRLTVRPTARDASRYAATLMAGALERHAALVLGLPVGRTMVPLYEEFARLLDARGLGLQQATTFNLDELMGLPPEHPGSFRAFMERHLFSRVAAPPSAIHFLDGMTGDVGQECARFEQAIERAGGIALLLLGIGENGHIGFNEPAAALAPRTHLARLTLGTRRANAGPFGGRVERVPRTALSMGMATILGARSLVLLATGRGKRRAVRDTLSGPITTRVPASFLQLHADVDVVLDRAAAGRQ